MRLRYTPLRWLALAAMAPFFSCAIREVKHECAQDDDCLAGHECRAGVCAPVLACNGACGGKEAASGAAGMPDSNPAHTGGSFGTADDGGNTGGGRSGSAAVGAGGAGGKNGKSGTGGSGGGAAGRGEAAVGGARSAGESGEAGVDQGGANGGDAAGTSMPPVVPPVAGDDAGGAGSVESGSACEASDETVVPACFSTNGDQFPAFPISVAAGLATTATQSFGGGYGLYVAERGSSMFGVTWTEKDLGNAWGALGCFDSVPEASRMAATTLRNDVPEVFAVGRCGQVYSRTIFDSVGIWGAWTPIVPPRTASVVTDVATALTPDGTNLVYVADRGTVFVHHRVGASAYAAYSDWTGVGAGAGSIVTAGVRSDGRQQVFTLDSRGRPRTSVQVDSDVDAAFGPWSDFGADSLPTLIDVEAPYGLSRLELFALGADGSLWHLQEDGTGGYEPWGEWVDASPPVRFLALSGAGFADSTAPLVIAAVGESGTYARRRVNGVWEQTWTVW